MHRLERLINLTAALLHTERPLSAEDIRERVPGYAEDRASFRRAFERDKDTLREMGVPVVVEHPDPENPTVAGYSISPDDYYLPDPGLEPDELAALHLAATAVHVEGVGGVEALWKLGGTVAEGGPAPTLAALPGAAHLAPLFAALSGRRTVAFAYRGEPRRVDPWRLSFRSGHWYVSGLDRTREAERRYRLDRIEGTVEAASAPGAFERPAATAGPAPPWQLGVDEAVEATLAIDGDQAGWALGQLGPDAVRERRDDGTIVFAVPVTNRDAFRSFVLGFLDHAEVLGPPELRADLIDWLRELCPA